MTTKRKARKRRPLSPVESAFMSYESELCDLARTVELALVALAAEQDAGAHGLVQVALEGLQTKTVNIKNKWYEDRARVFEQAS